MAVSPLTIEQKLAEFTEVHGTVLLGMHRDLQSHLQKVDLKLESSSQALKDVANNTAKDIQTQTNTLDQRYKEISHQVEEFGTRYNDIIKSFDTELVTYRNEIKSSEQNITTLIKQQWELLNSKAKSLDNQAKEIQTLNKNTRQLILEHQKREALFNKRVRLFIVVVSVISGIAVILGVWKPWIH